MAKKTPAKKADPAEVLQAAEAAVQATETPATETQAAPAEPKSRGPRGVPETATLNVLVSNPKREGSKAQKVFALYQTGQTIAELFELAKEQGADLAYITPCLVYDAKHGFISIEGYDPGEIVQPKPKKEKAPKEPKAPKAKKEKVAKRAGVDAIEQDAVEETLD